MWLNMKTNPALVIALVVLAGARIAGAATWETTGPNLLTNGGFEQGMAAWGVTGQKAAVALDDEVRHAGRRALRISATGRPGEVRVIAGAAVNPAKKYRVQFMAKARDVGRDPKLSNADFANDMAAAVGLIAYAGNQWLEWCPTEDAIGLRGTSDWTSYSFDVMKLPPETTSIQLHLRFHNGAKGSVWFDDVALNELTLHRPSLVLGSAEQDNVFALSEKRPIKARIMNDATPRRLTLRWEARESRGMRSVKGERHIELAATAEHCETIPLEPQVGHYVVTAELTEGNVRREQDRVEAAVVPDPSQHACPNLGLWNGNYHLARKAGMSWTRDVAYWRYLEPEPGVWHWAPLEKSLKGATAAGLKVVLCFSEISQWESSAPPGSAQFFIYPPKHWDELGRFVEKVVERVGKYASAWEIWNEPVIPWGWKGTAQDIVTLHRVIYEAIRRVRPDAIILGPCINEGAVPTLSHPTFKAVLPLGILRYCDGLVIHPYREPRGPEATFFFEELGQLRRLEAEHDIRQGTWITEIGWSSSEYPWGLKEKTSEIEQAAYLVRSVVAAVAQQVRLYNWHEMRESDIPDPHERAYGLVRRGTAGPSRATWPTPCVPTIWPGPASCAG